MNSRITTIVLLSLLVLGTDAHAAGELVYLIDSGSKVATKAADGRTFAADTGFIGGKPAVRTNNPAIANTDDDFVYQTERYCMDGYRFAVANGSYLVTLLFAETYTQITAAGQRVFDIAVEDMVMTDFDIFKAAGGLNKAIKRASTVNVKDGFIDIKFTKKTQCPVIDGIEVSKAAAAAPAPAPGTKINPWISEHFKGVPVKTGDFKGRITLETPVMVKDATGCCGKYAFELKEVAAPVDKRAAFVNVKITNLTSSDAYGSAISTKRAYPDMNLFLSNVYIEPNWPTWVNYSTTNKDGVTLDDANEVLGEDVTIKNYNADTAIDNKANSSQFVRLTVSGKGHRTIRYWNAGPHYLVDSNISNTHEVGGGVLLWIKNCSTFKIYIYNSKFDGAAKIPAGQYQCETGTNPSIVYLTKNPKTTGEMHPMFNGR